jgi:hypothetical protein
MNAELDFQLSEPSTLQVACSLMEMGVLPLDAIQKALDAEEWWESFHPESAYPASFDGD